MWPKHLPLATLSYNTFNTPNLANYISYELVFGRKPKLLVDLERNPDIKVSGTFKDHYTLLNKLMHDVSKILRGLFEHERLKPAIIRTNQGNIHNSPQLKQVINIGITV